MISPEGERALRKQLAELLRQRDEELPRRLQEVREFGSGSENDDFLQILEEEAVVEARIRSIQGVLATAEVIDPATEDAGVAGIGSTVTLKMGGREVDRRVIGAHEPVGIDGVSAASPIGQAIIGSRAGETVTAELPDGREVTIEIVTVDGKS